MIHGQIYNQPSRVPGQANIAHPFLICLVSVSFASSSSAAMVETYGSRPPLVLIELRSSCAKLETATQAEAGIVP